MLAPLSPDGNVAHLWWTSSSGWNTFKDLGGAGLQHVSTITWPDTHAELFALGPDGSIWHDPFDFASVDWAGWTSLGGSNFVTGAGVIEWTDGHVELFATDAQGAAWHSWSGSGADFPNGWHAWASRGGARASPPLPVRWADDHVEVFARGTDGRLWSAPWANGNWQPFAVVDATTTIDGEPGAGMNFDGGGGVAGPEIVARRSDGAVVHLWWDGTKYTAFTPLLTQTAGGDPFFWTRLDKTAEVFVVDPQGNLTHTARRHVVATGRRGRRSRAARSTRAPRRPTARAAARARARRPARTRAPARAPARVTPRARRRARGRAAAAQARRRRRVAEPDRRLLLPHRRRRPGAEPAARHLARARSGARARVSPSPRSHVVANMNEVAGAPRLARAWVVWPVRLEGAIVSACARPCSRSSASSASADAFRATTTRRSTRRLRPRSPKGDPRAGAAPMYLAPPSADAPPPSPGALNAVVFATSRVGAPYCWGGAGPACFDCSGLTSAAWREGGKRIPRTSLEQAERLPAVPLSMAAPGDILWKPGHVGIYVGGGWVVAAIGKGDVVRYQPASHFVRALRP